MLNVIVWITRLVRTNPVASEVRHIRDVGRPQTMAAHNAREFPKDPIHCGRVKCVRDVEAVRLDALCAQIGGECRDRLPRATMTQLLGALMAAISSVSWRRGCNASALNGTASIAPRAAADCINRPRADTSSSAASRSITPAAQAQTYSPRLCPIIAAGHAQASHILSSAYSIANRAGCTNAVCCSPSSRLGFAGAGRVQDFAAGLDLASDGVRRKSQARRETLARAGEATQPCADAGCPVR